MVRTQAGALEELRVDHGRFDGFNRSLEAVLEAELHEARAPARTSSTASP